MGVVIGVLDADGDIATNACRDLIYAARGLGVTFHRAFDLARDPCASARTHHRAWLRARAYLRPAGDGGGRRAADSGTDRAGGRTHRRHAWRRRRCEQHRRSFASRPARVSFTRRQSVCSGPACAIGRTGSPTCKAARFAATSTSFAHSRKRCSDRLVEFIPNRFLQVRGADDGCAAGSVACCATC